MTELVRIPVPVTMLMAPDWNHAFGDLLEATKAAKIHCWPVDPRIARAVRATESNDWRTMLEACVDYAFSNGHGEFGVGLLMLLAVPGDTDTYVRFMPMLARMFARAASKTPDRDAATRSDLLAAWWKLAADEHYRGSRDPFAVAHGVKDFVASRTSPTVAGDGFFKPVPATGPMLRVMSAPVGKKLGGDHGVYTDALSKELPLTVCPDVATVRAALEAEYPHAVREIHLLTRDLREGKPLRLAPVILCGPPGCGKSRLVRRLSELLGGKLHRHDCTGSGDVMFSGTAKGWGATQPCVPARAIAQTQCASPILLLDELDKSGSHTSGSLYASLAPFLERETSARHHDQSLDTTVDLSWVSYCATANDDKAIPDYVKDRFRIIRMPAPGLPHLPRLAAQVMSDLAREDDEDPAFTPALSEDELDVIGRAWSKAGLSMRALQRCVRATLDARAAFAPRH
jgi:hypothetical protein